MKTFFNLSDLKQDKFNDSDRFVLSIGSYDGIHLGHQSVLTHLKNIAKKNHAYSCVLTFSNHPKTILYPTKSPKLITSLYHKLKLLKENHIDITIAIPFTKNFSNQSPEMFLSSLKNTINFSHLILGPDAALGKNRSGDKSLIQQLAKKLCFSVTYLPKLHIDNQRISSSLIRSFIQEGNLIQVEKFLGRPYSIFGDAIKGSGIGKTLSFPTLNIAVDHLCLPPFGVYSVTVNSHQAIANLGIAPTINRKGSPILEVHLINPKDEIPQTNIEVVFKKFIRKEIAFSSLKELQKQIEKDIKNL